MLIISLELLPHRHADYFSWATVSQTCWLFLLATISQTCWLFLFQSLSRIHVWHTKYFSLSLVCSSGKTLEGLATTKVGRLRGLFMHCMAGKGVCMFNSMHDQQHWGKSPRIWYLLNYISHVYNSMYTCSLTCRMVSRAPIGWRKMTLIQSLASRDELIDYFLFQADLLLPG
jgi:hypothetical protein